MSVRCQHYIDHADNIQKAAESPDCLLGVVTQPTDSRLSETSMCVIPFGHESPLSSNRFYRKDPGNHITLVVLDCPPEAPRFILVLQECSIRYAATPYVLQ